MSAEGANAVWAVVRREILEIQDELQRRFGGDWTIAAATPRANRLGDFWSAIELYGRPPGVRGRVA